MKLHHFRFFSLPAAAMLLLLGNALSVQAQQIVGAVDDMPDFVDFFGRMSLNPSSGLLYVPGSGHVYVVDTAVNAVVDELDVTSALSTAYDPIDNQIYVSLGAEIAVYSADTHQWVHSIPAPAWFIDVNPLTRRVYSVTSDLLWVAELAADPNEGYSSITTVPLPLSNCWDVIVHPGTNTVYLSSFDGLIAVDGETHEILAVIRTDIRSYLPRLAIDVELDQLYLPVVNGVLVVDCVTNRILQTIAAPGEGMGIGVDVATHRVYVTNDFQGPGAYNAYRGQRQNTNGIFAPPDGLLVLDGNRRALVGKHQLPYCQDVAVDPLTGLVYLAERGSPTGENDLLLFEDVRPQAP